MKKSDRSTPQRARKASALDAHIGARLKERRLAIGLSQQHLGAAVGIAEQQIQKYEAGRDRISASRLFLLATVLGVTTDWFFLDFKEDDESRRGSGRRSKKLEQDVITLLETYRSIGDPTQKDVVLKIARSLARKR
jgi:transcriptional regulator with XRE-family HTH domain